MSKQQNPTPKAEGPEAATMTEEQAQTMAAKAAAEAAERAQREAAERALVAELKAALEPLATIRPQAPYYDPEGYRINRARQTARISRADIERARAVRADPAATAAQCRAALAPLARLPLDVRVEDPRRVLYSFPAEPAGTVDVTTETIELARRLAG